MMETATCSRIEQGARCRLPAGHKGDCYCVPRKHSGQGQHPLDGTRTPDVEDFEDKLAVVMDGCRIDDRREVEHIVLEQRLDQAQARQRRAGGSLFS